MKTCQICGRSLTETQRQYCGRRCAGLGVSRGTTPKGGKLLDLEWRKARGRKAGQASAVKRQALRRERVEGLSPVEAWTHGYKTAQVRMRRHYTQWAVAKAAELVAARQAS